MRNFENHTEKSFYDFMLSSGRLLETASWSYVNRLRGIRSLDVLENENIDFHISNYTTGPMAGVNRKNHGAYSSALKWFKRYVQSKAPGATAGAAE